MTLPRLNFDQAKRAKAVGFDLDVDYYFVIYNNGMESAPYRAIDCARNYNSWEDSKNSLDIKSFVSLPENALFLQWCREVRGLHGWVSHNRGSYQPWTKIVDHNLGLNFYECFNSHPEAETALVDEVLDILEK